MPKKNLSGIVLDNFFEGYTLDKKGNLKVVNEKAATKARDALSKLVLEMSREWWDVLESAEDSLANVANEISFAELNADPSSLKTSRSKTAAPKVAAPQGTALPESVALENLLGSEELDLNKIFEMGYDDQTMLDDVGGEDRDEIVDGDDDFSDLTIGMDDAGMGGTDLDGDEGDDDVLNGDQDGDQDGDQYGDQYGDQDADLNLDDQNGDQYGDQDADLNLGDQNGDQDADLNLGDQDSDVELDIDSEEIDLDGDNEFDFDFLSDEEEEPRMESEDKDRDDEDEKEEEEKDEDEDEESED